MMHKLVTSCAEPGASAASARFCYPACGLPGSGWPLHRLRTACAQSHFGVLFINRTRSLFFITKRSIISAKSPGFIIFWKTLICSPVINTDSGFIFITFTLCNSYKSEGNLSFYYRHWNDRPNRVLPNYWGPEQRARLAADEPEKPVDCEWVK